MRRGGLVLAMAVLAMATAAVSAEAHADERAAALCSEHHKFGAQPVDVAKTTDGQTILAQVSWGHHPSIGCYLVLNDDAAAALRAAGPPLSLPRGHTDASRTCSAHHKFGAEPVDVAKTTDGQTVLARLSWGHHPTIGCYLTLDDTALTTLRSAHTTDANADNDADDAHSDTPEEDNVAHLSAQEVYARVAPSIPIVVTATGHGSGILIPGGYVITNHHVVWPNDFDHVATVVFSDGTAFDDVPVLSTNPWADIAVLGPLETDKRPLPLSDGEQLPPGSNLYLIGYPAEYEHLEGYAPEPTITSGLLSRVRHWDGYDITLLQTDAAIAGGQSGGALVDGRGRVVGVSTWGWTEANFGVATSASDDAEIVELMLTGTGYSSSFHEKVDPYDDSAREWDIELAGAWDSATFFVDEVAETIDLEIDGSGEAYVWLADSYDWLIGINAEDELVASGTAEIDPHGLYFVEVFQGSAGANSYTLSSSAALQPYYDEDGAMLLADDKTSYARAGVFDYRGDIDAYLLELQQGETVVIWTDSIDSDTALSLYDSESNILAEDDDSGPLGILGFEFNAEIMLEAPSTGTYYINVYSVEDNPGGSYIINAEIVNEGGEADEAEPDPEQPDPEQPDPTTVNPTFTDSTGRRIRYRVYSRDHWDLSKPRGAVIFFHGNNNGTEDDMLSIFGANESVLEQGLLFIVVASPGSHDDSDHEGSERLLFGRRLHTDGTRGWTANDFRLIHELLQSNLGGTAAIDHNRIVFQGGSDGTGFLARFLERYFAVYGGGFHAHCGYFWGEPYYSPPRRDPLWSPTIPWSKHTAQAVAQRMRVFVEATTEDFLHDDAVAARDYYRDVLGLGTRWDLDAAGSHCWGGATPRSEIVQWLSETPNTQGSAGTVNDHDGDGLANALDPDDDNDGALDVIDALPLEPRDWLDTDSDGIGDFADRDADGDGVNNALDPFSLDPTEWRDNDEDGIGDNIDKDDDNDGLADSADPDPLRGPRNDQLTFNLVNSVIGGVTTRGLLPLAHVHRSQPASVNYPDGLGDRQSWHSIRLGDGADPVFEIMVDSYKRKEPCEDVLLAELCDPQTPNFYYWEQWSHKIYIDKNRNRDLTDDGPPLVMARNEDSIDHSQFISPSVGAVVKVPYSTGELLPYGLLLSPVGVPDDIRLLYKGASTWMGLVSVPDAEPVLVGTVDANLDGVFNSGTTRRDGWRGYNDGDLQDFACVDTNRDGWLSECDPDRAAEPTFPFAPVYENEPFLLNGRTFMLEITPTGHTVQIRLDTGRAQTISAP